MPEENLRPRRPALLALGCTLIIFGGITPFLAVDLGLREWIERTLPTEALRVWAKGISMAGVLAVSAIAIRRRTAAGLLWVLALAYGLSPLAMNSAVLALASLVGLAGFALACVGLGAGPSRLDALATTACRRLRRLPRGRFRLLIFGLGLAANLFVAWIVFGLRPSIIDTFDQVFQARIFTAGAVTTAAPPVPRAFEFLYMIIDGDRWYSQYPPGHPLLLALGALLGATWLVGPLLGALLPLLVLEIGRAIWGERTGRVAAALALLSPYLHLMAGSHMSHTTCAAALALGVWGLVRAWRGGGLGWAVVTGAGFGYAMWTRPYPALATALTAAGLSVIHRVRGGRVRWWVPAAAVVVAAIPVALLLLYNKATNGDPFVFGYNITQGPLHRLGFGVRKMNAMVRDFTMWEAIRQTGYHLNGLNALALGTAVPMMLIFPWTFLARRRHPFDLAVLALIAAPIAAFFIYPFTDFVLGPRLVFSTLPFATLLAARSLVRVNRVPGLGSAFTRPAALLLLIAPFATDLAVAMSFNRRLHRTGHDRIAAKAGDLGTELVLCDDATFGQYGFAELRPGLPADRPIFARDRHASGLIAGFPGRSVVRLALDEDRNVVLEDYRPHLDLFRALAERTSALVENRGMESAELTLDFERIVAERHAIFYGFRTPASAAFTAELPPDAWLRFSAIVHPDAWSKGSDGVTFRVRLKTPQDPAPRVVFDRHLGRGVSLEALLDREVDLRAFAGQRVTLWIEALPGPGGPTGDIFDISNPQIVRRIPR